MGDEQNKATEELLKPERLDVNELLTPRLKLRRFVASDADVAQQLLNDRELASNTRSIPYPYPEGAAAEWIELQQANWEAGKASVFAICDLESSQLIGAIGLEIAQSDHHAELGYWIGREFRNRGICSEAGKAVLRHGFEHLGLHRIHANFMTRNPASGRVMEKIGMRREGLLRGHARKWGVFEDIIVYGVLASDSRPE